MPRFIQLHLLTAYPPSNPNRDETGRPKSAIFGGQERLRISSQCLKRAWRTSDIFQNALEGHLGTRTRVLGRQISEQLQAKGFSPDEARKAAEPIAEQFGKLKSGETVQTEQAAHFSPEELAAINALVAEIARGKKPELNELKALVQKRHTAADIALFGRMLASRPEANTDAAVQVAHAITVHRCAVENDFFTAVDDLNRPADTGSAFMGDAYFGAGLYYLYLCIDSALLLENLGGDEALAKTTLEALVEAAATVAPSGQQNRSGSRVRASYVLAEKGDQQPRSLSVAFLKPIKGEDILSDAIDALTKTATAMNTVYGDCNDDQVELNAHQGEGCTLGDLKKFVAGVYA